jgi:protein TonB
MFGDTLLESSSASGKRKRWPMATAFTVEAIIAAIVVIIPLLSTGVIPVSARVPLFTPVKPVIMETAPPISSTPHAPGPANGVRRAMVIMENFNPNAITYGPHVAITDDPNEITPSGYVGPAGAHNPLSELIGAGPATANVKPGPRRIVSQLEEAQLLNRVEPVYPHIAEVTGIQGQVRLQAIIARDGSIQSLKVISGQPMLASAALDAVKQWRYRPYVLNGEVVEVETLITVNFRKGVH